MKNIITKSLKGLLLVPALAFVLGFAAVPLTQPVAAFDQSIGEGADSAQGKGQSDCLFAGGDCTSTPIFQTITNVLLFILGAISVIMIIIGGLRYVISGGNATAVTAAKNTILYAIVGVIVALLAYAVVNFVLTSFSATGSGGTNV